MVGHEIDIAIPYTYKIRHWKDHFKSDLGSNQDHCLKKDLESDQDQIKTK
jgi:hypothetical protein